MLFIMNVIRLDFELCLFGCLCSVSQSVSVKFISSNDIQMLGFKLSFICLFFNTSLCINIFYAMIVHFQMCSHFFGRTNIGIVFSSSSEILCTLSKHHKNIHSMWCAEIITSTKLQSQMKATLITKEEEKKYEWSCWTWHLNKNPFITRWLLELDAWLSACMLLFARRLIYWHERMRQTKNRNASRTFIRCIWMNASKRSKKKEQNQNEDEWVVWKGFFFLKLSDLFTYMTHLVVLCMQTIMFVSLYILIECECECVCVRIQFMQRIQNFNSFDTLKTVQVF